MVEDMHSKQCHCTLLHNISILAYAKYTEQSRGIYILIYSCSHPSISSLWKKKKQPLSLSLSLSLSNGASHRAERCPSLPHVSCPPFAHINDTFSLNLLFHLELSPTGIEQCSLNPLFYLCRFGKIFRLSHPSCQWGWSHTCQSLRQIGSTVLQEHTTCPLHAIFCVF